MKLMASGVTNSAARVRSPSFSRSSSSTTTTMRPARMSASAPGTSVNGGSKLRGLCGIISFHSRLCSSQTAKAPQMRRFCRNRWLRKYLQRGLDLKTPRFEESLRDVLRVLVPAGPLAEACRTNVLIRGKLELLHNLLEGGNGGHNRPDGLRLAPVRISTTLCHYFLFLGGMI